MTINWEKIKNTLNWKNIRKLCYNFLEKKASWILFALIFALASYGTYLWYGYVYNKEWSEEKKRQYREEKGKGTVLSRAKFDEAIKNYNLRGDNFNKAVEDQKDIFGLDKDK